jgi:hypothetical protein
MDDKLFTDEQLVEATGLHIDNVRKLVTWGAVSPAKGGRGRGNIRYWYASTVRYVARVAALFDAGLSLQMAHTINFLQMLDVVYDFADPEILAMNNGDTEGWFDPTKPLSEADDLDLCIYVVNGRYVFSGTRDEDIPSPDAELMNSRTLYKTSTDFHRISEFNGNRLAKWQRRDGSNFVNPDSLAWEYDPQLNYEGWLDHYHNPISIQRINLSFATRVAMRKLLGIPVFFSPASSSERTRDAVPDTS